MEINRYITDRTKQFFYLADERIDAGSREILKKKFRSMPYINELSHFLEEWFDDSPYLVVNTSGSTGKPKPISVNKEMMMHSALNTCRTLGLSAGDTALLCMPLDYIAGKMMVVRALVASLKFVTGERSVMSLSQTCRFVTLFATSAVPISTSAPLPMLPVLLTEPLFVPAESLPELSLPFAAAFVAAFALLPSSLALSLTAPEPDALFAASSAAVHALMQPSSSTPHRQSARIFFMCRISLVRCRPV